MIRVYLRILILIITLPLFSQAQGFEKREFIYKGDTLRYQVLFPENYDRNGKYPLVLFLHGAGERGTDNEKQLTHGAGLFTDENNRRDYPSIVIFPQCPEKEYWVELSSPTANGLEFNPKPKMTQSLFLVKKLVDTYRKEEAVDKNRIYVMGLSMGGMGTFDLISRYPKYFAAAIPICGGVHTARLKKLKKLPIRIFHGAADNVVSVEFSRNAYIELKANGSQRVEFKEFQGVGHDSWTPAFAYPDFLDWMYYHRK